MQNYIAQAVGIVGLIVAIISFQQNTKRKILFLQIVAAVTFTVHFLLLGANTGAAMNIIGGIRNLIFINDQKEWAKHKAWFYGFLILFMLAGVLTWKNIYSILPTVGMLLGTVAYWMKDTKLMRRLLSTSSVFWLVYNISSGSYPGIITEIFVQSSIITAMFRFDFAKKKENAEV